MNRIKRSVRFYLQYVNKTETVTLAYYFILGLVPMITLINMVCGYLELNTTLIINSIGEILPSNISPIIASMFMERKTSLLSWFTIIICIYVSSKGTYRMILAVDKMYHVRQEMSFLNLQLHAIFDIFLIMVLFTAALFGFGLLPTLMKEAGLAQYTFLPTVIGFFIVFLMLLIVYKTVPSIHLRFRDCILGALCATVLFAGIALFYTIYLKFAKMSNVYGDYAWLALVLMSVEYFCQAIYFGFAVNALIYIE